MQAGAPPEEAGATGDTNGAAMRIAPVGIATPFRATHPRHRIRATSPEADNSKRPSLENLVDHVEQASFVTHGTSLALAGAAAVAAAVSAGVSGASVPEAIAAAIAAARIAAGRGRWVAGADVAARIEWATQLVAGLPPAEAADVIYRLVGTGLATQESVPAAFAALDRHPR